MKIEVFLQPKDGDARMTPSAQPDSPADGKAQQKSALKIPWKLMVLSLLLLGSFIMCGMASYSAYNAITAMDELTVQHPAPTSQKQGSITSARPGGSKSRVDLFDNSQPLRRGDVVVVRRSDGSNVGEVAVAANSTGVVKRNGNVEALYLLGENRYVVESEGRTRVVHGNEILATVTSTAKQR